MTTTRKTSERIIGHIGVDAGMIMLGDPCGLVDTDIGRMTWDDFLDLYIKDHANVWHIQSNRDDVSDAIVVSSGYGDGVYPVKAKFTEDGRITSVTIEFLDDDNEPV